jgi:DNA-binding MarR family transcriptional regulator
MGAVDGAVRDILQVTNGALGTGTSALDVLLRLLQTEGGQTATTGTVVVAGGWAGWRYARRLLPVGVALYARIRKLDLAKHPARAALLATIRAEEGATTRDLILRTQLKKGTALHHLRTLERGGLVKSRKLGRDRAWYDAAAARADPTVLRALHAPTRQRILALASARPGITQAQLARELGFARATVHQHVAALRAAELLDVRRAGMRTGCFLRTLPLAQSP